MLDPNEYVSIPERIKSIYGECNPQEQIYLKQILYELAVYGTSDTYNDLWLADYKEIPVSIDIFVRNDLYLGKVTREGTAIYPHWHKVLSDIFTAGNKYSEIVFTGATRIGKSSTAITGLAYMLYKLMCLKDPQKYFNKKDVSKFTILFFNITKDLAKGVAFREFNDTLRESPWFQSMGHFTTSENNFYYVPDGGKIVIAYGSTGAHALGQQVFCLVGNTEILTDTGYQSLQNLCGQQVNVIGVSKFNQFVLQPASVQLTGHVSHTIRLTLENGSVIEGTPDHLIMLSDGSYKPLKDISYDDDIASFESGSVGANDETRKFTVYIHTTPSNKRYIGITSQKPEARWGKGGKGYMSNLHFWSAICKYGWDNINHEIVATNLTLQLASCLESNLIAKYHTMDPNHGYNHTTGGNWSKPSKEICKKLSQIVTQLWKNENYRNLVRSRLKGHKVSEATKHKISIANLGRVHDTPHPMKGKHLSLEHIQKLRGHRSWSKGLTKYTSSILAEQSRRLKGRKFSDSSIAKMRIAMTKRFSENIYIWVHSESYEKLVSVFDIDAYLQCGYQVGRLDKHCKYITNGTISIKVPESQLSMYISNGWSLGRGDSVRKSLKAAGQQFIWSYENKLFATAQELADYLKHNGYPNIVASTITSLYRNGAPTSSRYYSLVGKITRSDYHADN